MPKTVADRLSALHRAAPLEGAASIGEAWGGERLHVRVGLWLDRGRVVRARYRATTCASLLAYAEVACEQLEAGAPPASVTAAGLRAALRGVHPVHHDRAELVAGAVHAAAASTGSPR
ncbi:MAG: hypothetical protein QM767_17950 [Anaeromyxobacter sp.]